MLTPDSARGLVEAGASVILVLLVAALLFVGYRFIKTAWDEKSALIKTLTSELAESRASLDKNTETMKANAADATKAIDVLRQSFERELRELTDELRWDQRDRLQAQRLTRGHPGD